LALAWLLRRAENIIPIPGTRKIARLEENIAAADIVLTPADVARLEAALPAGAAAGDRYPAAGQVGLNA
jgi:aryl-alcohol dehydrogenase-like predicted oxidoreductase